jgi:hypothetical protein
MGEAMSDNPRIKRFLEINGLSSLTPVSVLALEQVLAEMRFQGDELEEAQANGVPCLDDKMAELDEAVFILRSEIARRRI